MKVGGENCLLRPFFLGVGVLLSVLPFPVHAAKSVPRQPPLAAAPALTVEELIHHSTRAFAAGDWRATADHCIALLRDYGDRGEIAQTARRFQLVLLECHLRLNEWAEALPLFDPAARILNSAPRPIQGELLLQKANCQRQLGQFHEARESITASLPLLAPVAQRRADATLLLAVCMLESNDAEAAGNLVEESLAALPDKSREQAVMLGMQSFLKAGQPQRAYTLFSTALANTPQLAARIGIQLLLLEVGSASLENENPKIALIALARIHPPEKLVEWQKQRATRIRKQSTAERSTKNAVTEFPIRNHEDATPLESEIDALGNGGSFSESARLLSASAHRALNRHLEAALILEDTVSQLPASEAMEVASLESAKGWFELERWQRVLDCTNRFAKAYPASKHDPLMRYLKGCAEQKAGALGEALATFQSLAKTGALEFAVNAAFMHAVTLLLDNRIPEAIEDLVWFLQKHRRHPLAESAAYFLCVAKGRQGPPQSLRSATDAYLKAFSNGAHRPVVLLKRAQSFSALKEKAAAMADLESLLANAPGHACAGEAALLLGDCRLSLGDGEGALAAWRCVPDDQVAAKEEGLLKCAKHLHRGNRFAELRQCLQQFDSVQADTDRVAEALGWLWKTCERDEHPEEAAAWALKRIESLGDDPDSKGADLLILRTLALTATGRQHELWSTAIAALLASAEADGRRTLHSRLLWADACALRLKNPAEASRRFIAAATLHPANVTSPAALADGAEAMEAAGKAVEAAGLWRELPKWHPDAPQLDRALYALARLDCAARRSESAWLWVTRFEKTNAASPLLPRLLLLKATLQAEQGRPNDALKILDQLLREKTAAAAVKAEALFRMGQIHQTAGALTVAISYLQRTYVSYGRFQPWAARAYIASAEAFHALGDRDAARNTYREFLDSKPPEESPERVQAVSKLRLLEENP